MNDELHKLLGGSQKVSNMLLMQKSLVSKLSLEEERCGGNFKKVNTFVKTSIPSVYV